jgi:hypothetical protein
VKLKTRTKHLLSAPVAMAISAGGLVMGTATPAAAGDCSIVGCGEVLNNSGYSITAAGGSTEDTNGWCWSGDAPRYSTPGTNPFDCKVGIAEVQPGEDTYNDHFDDADSFRVDAGCKVTFKQYSETGWPVPDAWPAPDGHRYVEDRRGKAKDKWIKVTDNDTIVIEEQSCKGTPEKYYVDTWRKGYGYQDPYCSGEENGTARCDVDGELFVAHNYFFCKQKGVSVGTTFEKNHWWLLTDLDTVEDGRDGRTWVSAYILDGDGNTDNNTANYYDKASGKWKEIPDC